jgi:Flp pilus assembly protein TadD
MSPDGRRIVTASWDGTARVWDAATGRPLTPPLKHHGWVWLAAFSREGARILTASDDGTARVWEVATGNPVTPPLKHGGAIRSAAFSPDGRFVVTGSLDRTARVWDAATGQPLTPPLRHDGEVWRAAFSSDGRRVHTAVASVSKGGVAFVWDLDLSPGDRPIADLVLQAQLLASRQVDQSGDLAPVEPANLGAAWERLRPRYPGDFSVTSETMLAWHRREADTSLRQRQWTAALTHLNRLVEVGTAHWMDYAARGEAHAELGHWEAAAADHAQALELGANDPLVGLRHAELCLQIGDAPGYRRACRTLIARYGQTDDHETAHQVLVALTLGPDAIDDYSQLLQLVEQVIARAGKNNRILSHHGRVLYRAGRFREALQTLMEADGGGGGTAYDWVCLALVHRRLGRPEEAARRLEQATPWLERARQGKHTFHTDDSMPWDLRLELLLLAREAGALPPASPR